MRSISGAGLLIFLTALVLVGAVPGTAYYVGGVELAAWTLVVLAFGAGVGATELLSRYKDEPARAICSVPAGAYILINAAAASAAFALIQVFGWRFGLDAAASEKRVMITQAAAAGFGAMAVFRSSLFMVRVGDGKDVGVGPSSALQVLLGVTDRGVDRHRAISRAVSVAPIVKDLSFPRASVSLPAVCMKILQNLSAEEQLALGEDVNSLRSDEELDDATKLRVLGLVLMDRVGEAGLQAAVEAVGPVLKRAVSLDIVDKEKGPLSVRVGDRLVMKAEAKSADGERIPDSQISWSSTSASVVLVSSDGCVLGLNPGTGLVIAKVEGLADIVRVEVLEERRKGASPLVVDVAPEPTADSPSTPLDPTAIPQQDA